MAEPGHTGTATVLAEIAELLREQCRMLTTLGDGATGVLDALSNRLENDLLQTTRATIAMSEAVQKLDRRMAVVEARLTSRISDVQEMVQAVKADLRTARLSWIFQDEDCSPDVHHQEPG